MREFIFMYAINTANVFTFLHSLWGLIGGALRLDPGVFKALEVSTAAPLATLVLLFLAKVSQTLGQSVTLLVNRVTPRRFFVTLLVSGAIDVVSIVFLIVVIWAIGTYALGFRQSLLWALWIVSLAHAPLLFGIFILLPYMGTFLGHVLDIWSFLVILVALEVTSQLRTWQVVLFLVVGWAIFQLLKRTLGKPVVETLYRLRSRIAGIDSIVSIKDLTAVLIGSTTDDTRKREP